MKKSKKIKELENYKNELLNNQNNSILELTYLIIDNSFLDNDDKIELLNELSFLKFYCNVLPNLIKQGGKK